jgi:hypothetical protein
MKKLALTALLATMMIAPYAMNSTRASDTPECCTKKESCCPTQACCKGGSHSMCMMHMHAVSH